MIRFYTWGTPNGVKVQIMLEECNLDYTLAPVNLKKGEQRSVEFRKLNPNAKIPAIVDDDAGNGGEFVLAESGAILVYLADKTGRFLPSERLARATVLQWIMFQMAHIGPMFGQLHHFQQLTPKIDYAVARYRDESLRLLGVLEARLADCRFLGSDDYGIADICTWPWVRSWIHTLGQTLDGFARVQAWFDTIEARPAVRRSVETYLQLRASAAS